MNKLDKPAPSQTPEQRSASKAPASEVKMKHDSKVAPPVGKALVKPRHRIILVSFLAIVVTPLILAAAYLEVRAHDRYVSNVAFSIRSESTSSAMEMLGGLAAMSGSSSSDTDILYNFIKSAEMVRALDAKLNLREMWSKPGSDWWNMEDDPWYAYDPPGTIEDLTNFWSRMVEVYSDSGTGLIDVRAQAFTRDEAYELTQAIFAESSEMINRLSQIAREDKIRYAREELETSVDRLKIARAALTKFRNDNQIVDPQSLIAGQVGLLSSMQEQLAQSLIDLDTLRQTTQPEDPRITQTERRVEVISNRIAEERNKLGLSGPVAPDSTSENAVELNYANIVGDYETLAVDLQFAEQSYTVALTAYDTARAEAGRQSRYLAAHIQPSHPERSLEPNRGRLLMLLALMLSMTWIFVVLVGYSLRDRR